MHHKVKLEYNHRTAVTIKYINISCKCVIHKEGAAKSPPTQGRTRTTACLSTVDNWGHGAPGGHSGELAAEPWKTLITDQEISEWFCLGGETNTPTTTFGFFLERSLATSLDMLMH